MREVMDAWFCIDCHKTSVQREDKGIGFEEDCPDCGSHRARNTWAPGWVGEFSFVPEGVVYAANERREP